MPRTSAIIAAKRRLSTDFAIVVSFDVKEAAVSATLPRPETGLRAHVRRLGKGNVVKPRYVVGAVARATVIGMSETRGAIEATSLRDAVNLRLNPSKNQKEKGKNQRARS